MPQSSSQNYRGTTSGSTNNYQRASTKRRTLIMTPDEQEALSRKYGNDTITLLLLASGNIAVFNSARELCGTLAADLDGNVPFPAIRSIWFPPHTYTYPALINPGSPEDYGL